jgi:cytidylate kinase
VEQTNACLLADVREQVRRVAKREGISIAAVIRRATLRDLQRAERQHREEAA